MIYVLSDIHGRDDRFNSILKQIHLRSSDHLYILGDVIDRNDRGIRLLRRISRAKNMTMLLGNHEYMMSTALKDPSHICKRCRQRANCVCSRRPATRTQAARSSMPLPLVSS